MLCLFGSGFTDPKDVGKQAESEETHVGGKNCVFGSSLQQMWLLIGTYSATRKVFIFTDQAESFNAHLPSDSSDDTNLRITIHPSADAISFDLDHAISPWSSFRNKEVVSEFEAGQLNLILKKFVK